MMPSDSFASTIAAALPPAADPKELAHLIAAAVQQTSIWKWAEAQMVKQEVRGRYNERQQELPPPPEVDYGTDFGPGEQDGYDMPAGYGDQDDQDDQDDLFDAGPDDDDLF